MIRRIIFYLRHYLQKCNLKIIISNLGDRIRDNTPPERVNEIN